LPERPIAKAASGGELSRVMLAIEVVLGTRVGRGADLCLRRGRRRRWGAAALDIGARLARLARSAQVIVVTHLPQVAAFADRHRGHQGRRRPGDRAAMCANSTDDERARRELARMMAGTRFGEARSCRHARAPYG
jgi:DNA repair protein RecN (Recombination protein N)